MAEQLTIPYFYSSDDDGLPACLYVSCDFVDGHYKDPIPQDVHHLVICVYYTCYTLQILIPIFFCNIFIELLIFMTINFDKDIFPNLM